MADASTGGGGLIGGAADPNQPKCFGCCCFMRCGVVVGEILCIVWFTLNLLLGIFGILGATQPNDVARDAGLFCTLPDPVRAVYTAENCHGYDMCDCGGSICDAHSRIIVDIGVDNREEGGRERCSLAAALPRWPLLVGTTSIISATTTASL